jgi:iron(III) transport system ATP-binding protein
MEPAVLLFDEPLSNLDAKLRVYMRTEIRKIQQRIGITSVYVTHDQSEAMALSDKVIIMNGCKIEQVGSPTEIYQYPASHFVADFIGSANFVPARVKSVSSQGTRLESKAGPGMEIGTAVVEMFGQEFTAKCIQGELAAGDTVEVVIRPEAIELADDGDVKAEVTSSTYMGQMQDYVVQVGEQELVTQTYNPSSKKVYKPGETVYLRIQRESLHAIKK